MCMIPALLNITSTPPQLSNAATRFSTSGSTETSACYFPALDFSVKEDWEHHTYIRTWDSILAPGTSFFALASAISN